MRRERGDPVAGEAAVGLDLCLARTPGPDTAVDPAGAEPLEVRPQAAHPRQVVLELRELDLELALGAVRVRGEDVEDDRGAVDHRDAERRLEIALLARRELVVAGDEVRVGGGELRLQLLELAGSEVGVRMRMLAALDISPTVATPAVRSSSRSSARSCSSPSGSAAIMKARWRARPCGRVPSPEEDVCVRPWRVRCTGLHGSRAGLAPPAGALRYWT